MLRYVGSHDTFGSLTSLRIGDPGEECFALRLWGSRELATLFYRTEVAKLRVNQGVAT